MVTSLRITAKSRRSCSEREYDGSIGVPTAESQEEAFLDIANLKLRD
jgi:hypothetical protein